MINKKNGIERRLINPAGRFTEALPVRVVNHSGVIRFLSTMEPLIHVNLNNNFPTQLFLCEGDGRKGEGGLRTKGYFKHSYKRQGDSWHVCDANGQLGKSIQLVVESVVQDENLKNELIRLGKERIKQTSWESSAQDTLEVYCKAMI
jgi:hypothetical protein